MKLDTLLRTLKDQWLAAWPTALADWSPYVQLHEPAWCFSEADEQRESLTGSFAMIRLVDHSIVISLRQIHEKGLGEFAAEILAHEIGHHVLCPADLTDNARMLARIRRGLPGCEVYAPMVANLYADLLINDRLQRNSRRKMSAVYQTLGNEDSQSRLWALYMRTYEILWSLPPKTLTCQSVDARIQQDAALCARLIRSYAKDWLAGAGRFACLYFPYVDAEKAEAHTLTHGWNDTVIAGKNAWPDGISEIHSDEVSGAIHPAEDPILAGLDPIELSPSNGQGSVPASSSVSGIKTIKSYRDPFEYGEILKASGVTLSPREIAVRYYRERAIPFLVPFPSREHPASMDPFPEGLDVWDPSNEIENIDWIGTLATSPMVIPGITTRERWIGSSPGNEPHRTPIDLYLGVDCSGSMNDPAVTLSYPVLAGAVMALSALRAGAKVKVVLSGEPGKSVSTDGFVRDPSQILGTLVNYLGTGYSFGIHRLSETFHANAKLEHPVHVLILSDYDMFQMLDERGNQRLGWDVAHEAVQLARGGGTFLLQLPSYEGKIVDAYGPKIEKMKLSGWDVQRVNSMEELLVFARRFSRTHYGSLPPLKAKPR